MNKYDMSYSSFRADEAIIKAHKIRVRVLMALALIFAIVAWLQ